MELPSSSMSLLAGSIAMFSIAVPISCNDGEFLPLILSNYCLRLKFSQATKVEFTLQALSSCAHFYTLSKAYISYITPVEHVRSCVAMAKGRT